MARTTRICSPVAAAIPAFAWAAALLAGGLLAGCAALPAAPDPTAGGGVYAFVAPEDARERGLDMATAAQTHSPPSGRFGDYLAGRFARSQNDWTAASGYLDQVIAAEPAADDEVLRQAFVASLSAGDIPRALALAPLVPETSIEDSFARTLLAVDALKRGAPSEARAVLEPLPLSGVVLRLLRPVITAWSHAADGDQEAAMSQLGLLSGLSGAEPLKLLHIGMIADALDDAKTADQAYRALMRQRLTLRTAEHAGAFFERHGASDLAEQIYAELDSSPTGRLLQDHIAQRRMAGLPPPEGDAIHIGVSEALLDIAGLLQSQGAVDMALLFARTADHILPRSPTGHLMIGELLQAQDRLQEALDIYRAVPHDSYVSWLARERRARVLEDMGHVDAAENMLRIMIGERPERIAVKVALGDLLRRAERFEDAVAAYRRALSVAQQQEVDPWLIHYALGTALHQAGDWPAAEAELLASLDLRPDDPFALNYLGYTWIERGENLALGLAMVERAAKQRPNDGFIADSVGWAHYQLGNLEDAERWMERAIVLEPDDPVINDHLGDVYWRVGRRDEARFQWQRALITAEDPDLITAIQRKLDGAPPQHAVPDLVSDE